MSTFFRMHVDEDALTDALFAFVTDPRPSRNSREVITELHEIAPHMVYTLENMVIDGVEQRHYVAEYVRAALRGDHSSHED